MTYFTLTRFKDFDKDENGEIVAWYEIPELHCTWRHAFDSTYSSECSNTPLLELIPIMHPYLDRFKMFFDPFHKWEYYGKRRNGIDFIKNLGKKHGLNFDYHFTEGYRSFYSYDYKTRCSDDQFCAKVSCKDLDKLQHFIDDLNERMGVFKQQKDLHLKQLQEEEDQRKKRWFESDTYRHIQKCNSEFPKKIEKRG